MPSRSGFQIRLPRLFLLALAGFSLFLIAGSFVAGCQRGRHVAQKRLLLQEAETRKPAADTQSSNSTPSSSEPVALAPNNTPQTPSSGAVPTYDADVQKVFEAKCWSCHGAQKKGGLDMWSVSSMIRGGQSGTTLVPGKPDLSPIWITIEQGEMPPAGKPSLSASEKDIIYRWISSGAK